MFDAARSISDALAGMPKAEQERALRWAAENLGIQQPLPHSTLQQQGFVPAPPGGGTVSPPPASERPKDIKTFKDQKQPKSDNQYAAVVAYYYRFEAPEGQRRDTIDAEALQESTRQSGWRRLAAPRVTLSNAMAMGYLDRVDRGEYRINTVGENLVAMTLPGGGDTSNPARNRVKRKQRSKQARRKAGRGGGG